ncbi:SGIP1 protein, partial [Picathartes gymnocephalus]|nr:SGIP1 protein [Picathartes gymnocephalus]
SPHPNDPNPNNKPEGTREGGNKNGKKTNGAPNGFYAEIDWDRYVRKFLNCAVPTKGKHFYSSSESEEEEEAHKKFNIKIKPLQAKDVLRSAATVDELKASIGNIALSPSPVVSPSHFSQNSQSAPGPRGSAQSEEITRPRRSTPTPDPASKRSGEDPAALAPLFGPPLESAFKEHKLEAALDQPEIWGSVQPSNTNVESPKLPRPFPTGTPPPLPPKNIPATPPRTGSPLPLAIGGDAAAAEPKRDKLPSINDLDSIFGPVPSPKSAAATAEDKWVNFSDQSPENAPPQLSPREKAAASPPASPGSAPAQPPRPLPSPLQLQDLPKKLPELKDDAAEPVASPKDFGPAQRATPPPPPPPTYRAVVSSPGPGASTGSASGSSSPARPGTPLATCGTPPPPPPRPPSRPKLPPGKPPVSDVSRPFSPPIHSSSPPPIAPLARAESTSSISSTNSLSAATTPTVENEQPSLVWFDRGKFYLTFEG